MKKITIYLSLLFAFFVGITNLLAVDVYNNGVVTGYDVTSNPYSCNGVNKGVYNLFDENNYRYYSSICSVDFPCSYNSSNENSCVGQNRYSYTTTNKCYLTCDNYKGDDVGSNQHDIWNKISSYPVLNCETDPSDPNSLLIDSTKLEVGINTLINNNSCKPSSNFYLLREFEHENGSKIVYVYDSIYKCETKLIIKKECKGFSSGTFKIQVGNDEIELSCGQESDPIVVEAGASIEIKELNNEGYIVSMTNANNGVVQVEDGTTKIVTITNSLGSISINKTNAVNGSPMEGIVFALEKQVNGEWVKATDNTGKNIENIQTNSDGKLTFSGLLEGKYRVVEVSDSNGNFIASDPAIVEINSSNLNVTRDITNNPFKIKLLKVDQNGNKLNGAIFMIQKKSEDGSFETVSPEILVENGEVNLNLEKNGYYRITEIQTPAGYDILNDSIDIEIVNGIVSLVKGDMSYISKTEESGVVVLKIINDKSKIKIYKRDSATGNIISGAKFALTKVDGTAVEEFTTIDGAFSISLAPGSYILSELEAPKGYEKLKENIEFVVKEDGTIETTTNSSLFEIVGMSINIYNVKPTTVPDTGIGLNILLTALGISLLGGGSYIVYKNVKKSKNVK